MSGERMVRRKPGDPRRGNTDWERLKAMTEEEIEAAALSDPDNPPLDEEFFRNSKPIIVPAKKDIHLYVDEDIIDWFKQGGHGYQRRMNAVLRAYVEAHKESRSQKDLRNR